MKTVDTTLAGLSGQTIVDLTKKHTLFEWSAQGAVDPIPVAGAKGCWFWTPGRQAVPRLQQPVDVRQHRPRRRARHPRDPAAGGDARLREPVHGDRGARAARAQARRDLPGRHRRLLLHQRRRRGERERDQDRAAVHRPPQGDVVLPLVSRRHRGRDDADRRSAPLGRGARHAGRRPRAQSVSRHPKGWDTAEVALARIEETIELEGPKTIAAFILEPVTGTNGVLVPPDGFIQGIRDLCTKYGILMVADEVMSGFGRTGEWFAVDHWRVVPDLITMAKG